MDDHIAHKIDLILARISELHTSVMVLQSAKLPEKIDAAQLKINGLQLDVAILQSELAALKADRSEERVAAIEVQMHKRDVMIAKWGGIYVGIQAVIIILWAMLGDSIKSLIHT